MYWATEWDQSHSGPVEIVMRDEGFTLSERAKDLAALADSLQFQLVLIWTDNGFR